MRKFTIGQYYSSNSIIHKLDPRVKIFFTLLYLIELFVFTDLASFIILSINFFTIIVLSKVPIRNIIGPIGLLVFIIFISSFNLFWINGNTLLQIGNLIITDKGVITTIFISIRLLYILMSSSLMMLTTTPDRLSDAIAELLKPLNKMHIPINEMAMITLIMLRFIPDLFEEAIKIKQAQISRGADFETKNIVQRVKNYFPLLTPLFVSSFRHSNELALAMEARGYYGDERKTKLKPLKYARIDYIAYSWLILILILIISIHIIRA